MTDVDLCARAQTRDLGDGARFVLHFTCQHLGRRYGADIAEYHLGGLYIVHDEVHHRFLLSVGAEERLDIHVGSPEHVAHAGE